MKSYSIVRFLTVSSDRKKKSMGAAASVRGDLLSAGEIGERVANLGSLYKEYSPLFVDNGIDGATLLSLNSSDLEAILVEIGITKLVHRKVLCAQLAKFKDSTQTSSAINAGDNVNTLTSPDISPAMDGAGSSNAPTAATSLSITPNKIFLSNIPDIVTRSPRAIMQDLFQLQGIRMDPTDIDYAVTKIVAVIKSMISKDASHNQQSWNADGITRFDCFLNYRVNSEKELAERLWLTLKLHNIHAFLDKKCLQPGFPWKEGFLQGLLSSRMIVCLISKKALTSVRNFDIDHSTDNVLLEYETALAIASEHKNMAYVCPVHVGEEIFRGTEWFSDFNPLLYPDSVGPYSSEQDQLLIQREQEINADAIKAIGIPLDRRLTDFYTMAGTGRDDICPGTAIATQDSVSIIKYCGESSAEAFARWVSVMKRFDHICFPQFVDAFYENNESRAVFKAHNMTGGDLFDSIVKLECYNEANVRLIMKQILEGLAYLHTVLKAVHRDIKPENIILQSAGDLTSVKISGFHFLEPLPADNQLSEICGTPGYVAPEVLRGDPYGTEVDIWGLGVVMYILLCGYPPFHDDDQKKLFKKIKAGQYHFHEDYWKEVSLSAKDMVQKMICVDQQQRWTASQLLEHSWMLN